MKETQTFSNMNMLKLLLGEDISILQIVKETPVQIKTVCTVKNMKIADFMQYGSAIFIHAAFLLYNPINQDTLEYKDLIELASQDKRMLRAFIEAFEFFVREPINYIFPLKEFYVGEKGSVVKITEEVFRTIQKTLHGIFHRQDELKEMEDEEEILGDDKVSEIKRQMRINRRKVRRAKRKKPQGDEGKPLDIEDIVKILLAHTARSVEEIKEMSFVAARSVIKELSRKATYEVSVQAQMNGAKKIELHHWLEKEEED